jgi:hypothetical protein
MTEERHPHDLYETPAVAVDMLWRHHVLPPGGVWDPSCGRGAILKRIRQLDEHRYLCGSDLHDFDGAAAGWGQMHVIAFGMDFMAQPEMPKHCRYIVMNPPYKESEYHVRHALSLLESGGRLFALLRFNWIAAQRRANLLPYLRDIVICGRLKMLPPAVPDRGHGGTVDFAWFVFGPPCETVVTDPVQTFGCINITRAQA